MIFKSTLTFILLSSLSLLLSFPMYSQMCEGSSKMTTINEQNQIEKSTPLTIPSSKKKVNIRIPDNYQPPVANKKLITFPETVATKKKQKKMLKRRKKAKKKGCIAANM